MKEESKQFYIGDRVYYIASYPPDAPREHGIVSSVGNGVVFVRFDSQVHTLGWNEATAQGCDPIELTLVYRSPRTAHLLALLKGSQVWLETILDELFRIERYYTPENHHSVGQLSQAIADELDANG